MISSIKGKIIRIESDSVVIDVQGVGFDVSVTKELASETHVGDVLFLYTHLVVREDLLALYGFQTSEEKNFFLMFLGVEGIGPKLSLAILSTLSLDNIRRAILSEQPEFFSRVPGVGKKTAQKILIHMQGKVPGEAGLEPHRQTSATEDQVMEALVSLGYSVVEAQSAVQAIPKDTPDVVEEKLRIALQYFDHPT